MSNAPQTTVSTQYPAGIPGQLADEYTLQFGDVVTRTNQEASTSIPFGTIVKRGTTDNTCKMLSATSDVPDGIVVFGHQFDKGVELDAVGLVPKTTFGVLRKGRIFVLLESDVTPASEVHVRAIVNGGNVTIGIVRATEDANKTIDMTGFASFATSGSAGDIAILEVDMTLAASAVADT